METPEEKFVNGCQRTNRLSLMRFCYQSLLSLHLPQWLLWPLFLCLSVYNYLFLVQKRTSLHFSRKFPQCSLELANILRPETYVHLNLRSDYSPIRTEGRAVGWVDIQIYSNVFPSRQFYIPLCSFTNKVIHLHLSTAIGVELKLAFNQP